METASVKYELIPGKHQLCVLEAGDTMETNKRVKRRRRKSSVLTHVACKKQPNQQDQSQSDHSVTATTVKRSSRFRGVSRHRWTGRYEAHLWDKGSWNPTQKKKGKQVYLGAYDEEESAARAYDLAALKYWGTLTLTNFPVSDYEEEVEIMKTVTREQYLASLRRKSSGFSRGVSKYRGVARHHHNGRWEARIGRVFGNKYLYLGTYGTQEEAAHAYDIAAIEYRGINAVTNFDLSTYIRWLRPGGAKCFSYEEPNTSTSTTQSMTPSTTNTTPISKYTTEMSLFNHPNSFTEEEDDFDVKKQENIFLNLQGPTNSTTCTKSTSPTALGLLLKSSIFKELVKNNLNAERKDTEKKERNSSLLTQMKNDMSFGSNCNVPYMVSLHPEKMPGLVSQEDSTLPSFGGSGQFMRSLDMESSINPFN